MKDDGKDLLAKLKEREERHKSELTAIEDERKQIYKSLWEKTGINCIRAVYKFRDNFTKKVLKDFQAVNDYLAELEELNPGYLHFLETTDIWETPESEKEVKYLVSYLFGSAWRKDSDLFRVLGQISDTIDIPGNPFAKVGE